jgi:type II secretory pathway pseudopilin PulG
VNALEIVLLIIVIVVLGLIAGGLLVNARRYRAQERTLGGAVLAADQALATAHAEDKGWERARMEAAARDAFAARSDDDIEELHLVQVVDRPGTEEDEAVFRVVTAAGEHDVRLGRRDDDWVAR